MQIRFAAARPDGDYALILPAAGKDQSSIADLEGAAAVRAALARQRFEGEPGSAVELFASEGPVTRRLLVIGTGIGPVEGEAAEKLGGTAVAKLLTSGESHAVIDLRGHSFPPEMAARVALAAALRAWRYD